MEQDCISLYYGISIVCAQVLEDVATTWWDVSSLRTINAFTDSSKIYFTVWLTHLTQPIRLLGVTNTFAVLVYMLVFDSSDTKNEKKIKNTYVINNYVA